MPFRRAKPKADPTKVEQIVSEHYARVYRFCARRVGEQDAPDLAQETFVTMQQNLPDFQGKSKMSTWLLGIAHNHCRNHSRKRKDGLFPTEYAVEHAFDLAAPPHDNEVCDRQTLAQALESLSDEHREVVVLHELEGLTYAEIAEITQVPEGTVKSRLHHAFANLRKQILDPAPPTTGQPQGEAQ